MFSNNITKAIAEAAKTVMDATNEADKLRVKHLRAATAPAAAEATNEVGRPQKQPTQIKSLRYTIRPNGKFDIHAQTDFEGAVNSGIGGTLGMENNITYERLVQLVGKPLADMVKSDGGRNKRDESGWKTGDIDLTGQNV